MSLTPITLVEKFLRYNLEVTRTIFFSSYQILSRLNEEKDHTDLIEHYEQIDGYFWIAFVICILVLSAISFIDKYSFGTLRQINWWTFSRILVNQCI